MNPLTADPEEVSHANNPALNEDLEYSEEQPKPFSPVPFINTTLGIIPMVEHTMPEKVFQFWTGHTNFNLSEPVVRIISKIEGVETLDIYTRYRFRVGIGKAFKTSEVKLGIQKAVLKYVKAIQQA